ncbi:MerR family transcriptional regulator [Streptosporangium canum]|uniref:MerR family transcriptional regulator n=1 Tax=Streptosporangium canum TaxID=324952 RepID=UPI0036C22498
MRTRSRRLPIAERHRLAHAEPVRATIASKILGVDEKTVRAWVNEGLLVPVRGKPRLMLEAERLYAVATLVQNLRRGGRTRDLVESVWYRRQGRGLLEDDQFTDGLRQMEQGEGRPWREIKAEWSSKNSERPPVKAEVHLSVLAEKQAETLRGADLRAGGAADERANQARLL